MTSRMSKHGYQQDKSLTLHQNKQRQRSAVVQATHHMAQDILALGFLQCPKLFSGNYAHTKSVPAALHRTGAPNVLHIILLLSV